MTAPFGTIEGDTTTTIAPTEPECTCFVKEHYRANDPTCPVHRDPRHICDEESARMDTEIRRRLANRQAASMASIRRNLDELEQMPWAVAAANRQAAEVRRTFHVIDGGLS